MKSQATRIEVINRQQARRAARLHTLICIPLLIATALVMAYAWLGLTYWG